MENLIVWFNPKNGHYYHRFYSFSMLKIGDVNNYGHIVVQYFEYDKKLGFVLCNGHWDYLAKKKRSKEQVSLKVKLINNCIDWLNRIKG